LSEGNSYSAIVNPAQPDCKLFLMIDPVHTIKNIYNNFQKAKEFKYRDGTVIRNPTFRVVKKLYEIESSMSLRMAHKLTPSCLQPTNVQRTSVKLCMAIFHDSTVYALKYYSENGHPEFTDTYIFIKYISELVKILNVRTSNVGHRRNDELKLPISSSDDYRLTLLMQYAQFFADWKDSRLPGLTHETFFAIQNVCFNVHNIAIHLLNDLSFGYVLTGRLQSDSIEARFAQYRQMSGANFFISEKQLLESEKKIKLVSLMKNSGIHLHDFLSDEENTDEEIIDDYLMLPDLQNVPPVVLEAEEIQIIYYVSGYCSKRAKEMTSHCEDCKSLFLCSHEMPEIGDQSAFFEMINRGKLQAPSDQLFNIACIAYEVFCQLKRTDQFMNFLNSSNPATSFVNLIHSKLPDLNVCFICRKGHECDLVLRRVLLAFFNTLSRNFVRNLQIAKPSDHRNIAKLRSTSVKGYMV
jgi:hypothetical protein